MIPAGEELRIPEGLAALGDRQLNDLLVNTKFARDLPDALKGTRENKLCLPWTICAATTAQGPTDKPRGNSCQPVCFSPSKIEGTSQGGITNGVGDKDAAY